MNAIDPQLALRAVIGRVGGRIAPVWPLHSFVAVNPFMGLAEQEFSVAATTLRQVAGQEMLPPRAMFAAAIADGRITPVALRDAAAGLGMTAEALAAAATAPRPRPTAGVALVSDVLGDPWPRLVLDEIGKWCAAWLDEGQASWAMPWRGQPLYAAWRQAARRDRTPEVMGLAGFRAAVEALPEDPVQAVAAVLSQLELPADAVEPYLHRALLSVGGWAAMLRCRGWPAELAGEADDGLGNLLAIRLAWEAALLRLPGAWPAWQTRPAAPPPADAALDLALLSAWEASYQRDLAARLAAPAVAATPPAVQAAFCIDVRSEFYRRALEQVTPEVATIGFAGFFGFAIEYVRFGEARGTAQCPVLLPTGPVICEALPGAAPSEVARLAGLRRMGRRVADIWSAFRASAVSCFAYVETAGFLAAAGLLRGALGRPAQSRPNPLAPSIAPGRLGGRVSGLATPARLDAAEAVLRAMSLTRDFAGLVLLVGHGSSTVNNPHAAGLDCGACGGHTGESNARIAAAVLNDPLVRAGLAQRGIAIPADTWFLAGLHDTTTDAVTLFDAGAVPPSQAENLARLQGWLEQASAHSLAMRAGALGLAGLADPGPAIAARTRDWSEVRPEWALANNASFIAAPRSATLGRDLGGRAFLHSYDWRDDAGFGVLELIMTAPMVVASWINLQYYGSTVDNAVWGSGNKVLHNVTGRIGVLEGQGGDLRTGLPWQSVHDGQRFMHEPLRLSVVIAAPEAAMEVVLAKHAGARDLVMNGWLHLFSLDESGRMRRFVAPGDWRQMPA